MSFIWKERTKYLLDYLNRFKYNLVKDSARVTKDVSAIILRDWAMRAIEKIESDLWKFKKKDEYVDRINWEIKKL